LVVREGGEAEAALRRAQALERALTIDLEERRPDVTTDGGAEERRRARARRREASLVDREAHVLDALSSDLRLDRRRGARAERDALRHEIPVPSHAGDGQKRPRHAVRDRRAAERDDRRRW
jgi:hypothetical protein